MITVLGLRAELTRRRRRSIVLLVLGLTCVTLLWAHSAAGMGHDSSAGMEGAGAPMSGAMAMCLAILGVGGATAIGLGRTVNPFPFPFPRPVRPPRLALALVVPRLETGGPARAGPSVLGVFRL